MVEPITDWGQELAVPEAKALGFVDTESQFEAVTHALNRAGYPDSAIRALRGPDGVELLERLRGVAFYGDWERAVVDQAIEELRKGHFVFTVAVKDRDEAVRVADIAEPNGGHGLNYFGKWINEQLTR